MSESSEMLEGTFCYVAPGYGFITKVRHVRTGEERSNVLLRAATATKVYGKTRHLLRGLNGDKLVFTAAQSQLCGGKSPVVTAILRRPHYAIV